MDHPFYTVLYIQLWHIREKNKLSWLVYTWWYINIWISLQSWPLTKNILCYAVQSQSVCKHSNICLWLAASGLVKQKVSIYTHQIKSRHRYTSSNWLSSNLRISFESVKTIEKAVTANTKQIFTDMSHLSLSLVYMKFDDFPRPTRRCFWFEYQRDKTADLPRSVWLFINIFPANLN